MVSMTTFDVEFNTPVKPCTFTPGRHFLHKLKTGAPSITADSKRKLTPGPRGLVAQCGVGVRDGTFVRGDHVHAAREGRADVRDRGFAGGRIQRCQFYGRIRRGGIEKLFHGVHARSEIRFKRQSGRVHRRAVAQRVNAGNGERKFLALLAQEPCQRAAHVAISDQGELQPKIVAQTPARATISAYETASLRADAGRVRLSLRAAKGLEVISIDVEGGQSTLFVSPSGESMLVDAGWPGFNGRDAGRIAAAAKMAA